ncbi:hypothetical protein DQ04_09271000, partial [Trypanosoma grayi]|uniref:hypothetical protein n=1 Tax=Trypanosoma grayi TaxID=71804 RepID=UPI0004F47A80
MTTDDNEESGSSWNSLFLPLEEEVIFASFITLFCPTQPSQGREQQEREPQHQQRRVSTVDEADQYSAAEGENLPRNATGEDTRSPLFLLCGERADSVACVLRNRQVVFFDMTDERHGPKEVRRLRGTKNLRGCSSSEATCASLIPIEVAYMCRVPAAAMPPATPSPDAAGGGGGGGVAGPSNSLAVDMTVLQTSSDRVMYLRGVVGSNDGRVDVFSEHNYVFGFVAHDTPVVAVSAIYSGCASQEGDRDGARLNNGGDGGVVLPPFGNDDERRFENATANMGFVTCGSDGVLYVWKRQGLYLKPRVLEKSAFFSRTIKWQVVQPSCRDWLLGGMCTGRVPLVVHTTPGLEHELRARSSVTFDDAEPRVEL